LQFKKEKTAMCAAMRGAGDARCGLSAHDTARMTLFDASSVQDVCFLGPCFLERVALSAKIRAIRQGRRERQDVAQPQPAAPACSALRPFAPNSQNFPCKGRAGPFTSPPFNHIESWQEFVQ
jgi:hypothetical protein